MPIQAATFAPTQSIQDVPDCKMLRFVMRIYRRLLYWADILLIEPKLFVRDMILRSGAVCVRGWVQQSSNPGQSISEAVLLEIETIPA
jgi:hypothetical protein